MRLHQAVLSLNEQKNGLRKGYDKLQNEYKVLEQEYYQLKGAMAASEERQTELLDEVRKLREENGFLKKFPNLP